MIVGNVQKLKTEIEALQKIIVAIQKQCSHPKEALEQKSGSNTGNYDPSSDCYWKDYICHLCEKKWREDLGNGR